MKYVMLGHAKLMFDKGVINSMAHSSPLPHSYTLIKCGEIRYVREYVRNALVQISLEQNGPLVFNSSKFDFPFP